MKNKTAKKRWGKIISKSIKIKNGASDAKDRFADFFELPQEILKKTTKITIVHNDSVLIEGYEKIIDYLENYIKIRCRSLEIIIDGKMLDIKEMTTEDLVVTGEIYSVNYKKVGDITSEN
ncbi:sporulation protein YqfC [Clostridium sp. CAG:1219]|nr:sporulation protein YqfC [Clostridium sp. CAG:1219]